MNDQERIALLENNIKLLTARLNALCDAVGREVLASRNGDDIMITVRRTPPGEKCVVDYLNFDVTG